MRGSTHHTAADSGDWRATTRLIGLDGLFVLSLLSVLGLRLLPALGQSYFVLGLALLYIGYEMLQRRATRELLSSLFLLETVSVLFVITMMVVLGTGGLDSDLFFFLYALQVVVSLLLRPKYEWLILVSMLAILVIESDLSRLLAMTTVDSLILFLKLLSLVIFSPLVLWLVARYRQNEEHEQAYAVVEGLMRTYELEDDFIAQTAHTGLIVLDETGRVVEVNEGALRMLGVPATRVVGRVFRRMIKPILTGHEDNGWVEFSIGRGKCTRCRITRRSLGDSFESFLGEIIVVEDERIVKLMDEHHPPLQSKATGGA